MAIRILSFFIILLTITPILSQKKPFTIEDLYRVKNIGAPLASPSGDKIAFISSESNLREGKANCEIFLMKKDGSGIEKITNTEKSESSPIWFSENQLLYILDGQIYSYSLDSKESKQLTDFYMGISSPVLSPNKKLIAFTSDVYPECGADNDCNTHIDTMASKGPVQAYIADKLLFRHWTDYNAEKEPHLFIYNLETNEYKDLTKSEWLSGNFMLGGDIKYNFSPDSKEICFVHSEEKDLASTTNGDLWTIPVTGGTPVNVTTQNKALDTSPAYSPDGRYIAFKMQNVPLYEADRFRLAVINRVSRKVESLTEEFDYHIADFCWGSDSRTIYFTADVEAYSPLYKVDVVKKEIIQVSEKASIFGFSLSEDNGEIFFTARKIEKPGEIYRLNVSDKKIQQLTYFNKELLDEVDVRPAEQMWIEGADGKKVHVFLIKPHNFDAGKKYPLILNVHGGPQSQWMDSFRGDWQVYPGYGYIVAFPNPHGSTGYGQKYTEAISGDYGGKVYEDLMKVVDELEKLPFVDKERIGAMGWSYGGYMMNWFQAKTKRFKCLASMMGLYDLESMWGATEELWFVNWDLKGQPWNSDNYEKWSPSNFAADFSTPTLIITGERDYRVPYTQSIQYFTTLQTLGIDSRLIIFENDGHWPSSVKSMPLYYNAHLEWFHKYLGGDPAPYDSRKLVKNIQFENKKEVPVN